MKPRICNVTACPLHGRKPVWAQESESPIAMLIGEAPGVDEETYGVPFVGKSGQELDMYLSRFTKVTRDHFYITNILKCRPPDNRDPHKDEIECCNHAHLYPEIDKYMPIIIGLVGRVATHHFMKGKPSMEKVHGIPQWGWWNTSKGGFMAIPLYHPAYGLHSPRQMKEVIEDFTELGKVIRGRSAPRQPQTIELDYRLEEDNGNWY